MENDYWRTRTIAEAQARAIRISGRRVRGVSDLPWPLLIGRKGTTRDTFLGNIPLRCQRCEHSAPVIGVRHHGNTEGYAKP